MLSQFLHRRIRLAKNHYLILVAWNLVYCLLLLPASRVLEECSSSYALFSLPLSVLPLCQLDSYLEHHLKCRDCGMNLLRVRLGLTVRIVEEGLDLIGLLQ